jgi:GNAT superfamily N-acetyltransferase
VPLANSSGDAACGARAARASENAAAQPVTDWPEGSSARAVGDDAVGAGLNGCRMTMRAARHCESVAPIRADVALQGFATFRIALLAPLLGAAPAAGRSAELAFTVEEDFQSRGIGSLLMRHIIAIARVKGLDRLA